MGSNALMSLLDTVQVTVQEVTRKQPLAASMTPEPIAPVVPAVTEHPVGVRMIESLELVRTVGECGSNTRNGHVGRPSSFGMKGEKEGYVHVGPSWCTAE